MVFEGTREGTITKKDLETSISVVVRYIRKYAASRNDIEQLKKRVKRVEDHLNLAQ